MSRVARLTGLFKLLLVLIAAVSFCNDTFGNDRFQAIHTGEGLSLHKEMYMLPVTYSDEYNGKQTEAVFQLSAKHRLFGSRFYFGYTQISFWQAYDHNNSAPFRETNYNPEIFYRFKPKALTNSFVGMDIGFEHESNGQKPPVSRSWNLIYASPYYFTDRFLAHLKVRYRIPEDEKAFPDDPVGDDNPDITDYLGYTDIDLYYKVRSNRTLHLTLRGNVSTGRGIIGLSYTVPIPKSEKSFLFVRFSHGYGESMVDYKKELTRFGLGISFGL